ncbi:uncharacterized protein I303_103004 [Kwoniella dejecticola CBS 10117]|uniref:TERF2-interacting telomeric protein 1 Myb domain-containing protein n=1 Tax=Kwoniella dejecticola CBS 10117 TaxID=1296121 RepID=A0A1A6AAB7_9TREE|nr:uncharacterized protein I303_03023 [Kwoniella dejecticola CBS 10117]OBR87001.1 hypothetical protein I303_03023 [Kwoniella dejecticola CBS 10117]
MSDETLETLLWEQRVLFAEDQFPDEVKVFLIERITQMGGAIVSERGNATILLLNPSHPFYKTEQTTTDLLSKSYPQIPQPSMIPYHWISNIYHLKRMVRPENSPVASPIFTHPSTYEGFRPLKAWVSVNVSREQDETPEEAQASLVSKMECAGAVGVHKRAQADLLIVDESSEFAKKVHAEKKKYSRHWQKIVERDWVDNCLRQKKLQWQVDKETDYDNESFLGDDTPNKEGKGPGRPTGGPRVDYTPQDDDFLCRYLAAYHPTGAWASRKTYQNLAASYPRYPIAERHSAQSWHERFKKNAAMFDKRVKAFIQSGVDTSLKTKLEREKAQLAATVSAERIEAAEPAVQSASDEAGPSGSIAPNSANGRAEKRKLVELNDESPPTADEPSSGREKRPRQDAEVSQGRAESNQDQILRAAVAPDKSGVVTEIQTETVIEHTSAVPIPGPDESAAYQTANSVDNAEVTNIQANGVQTEFAAPDSVPSPAVEKEDESFTDLLPSASQLPGSTSEDKDTAVQEQTAEHNPPEDVARPASRAQTDINTDEESQRGEATQAILADFARAQEHADPAQAVRVEEEPSKIIAPEPVSSNQNIASPHRSPPTQNTQSSPIHFILSPPKRQSPLQAHHSAPASTSAFQPDGATQDGFARVSRPFQLEVNVRALPAGEATMISQQEQQPSQPAQETIEAGPASLVTPQRQAIVSSETPTSGSTNLPSGKPRLHDQIIRRRTLDRERQSLGGSGGSSRKKRSSGLHSGPDMVLRETSIPPQPDRSASTSSPSPAIARTRAPSPPLDPRERRERASKGQHLIQKRVEEYKKRVEILAERYGMTGSDIIKFVNETGSKGSGDKYWDDIERGLKMRR